VPHHLQLEFWPSHRDWVHEADQGHIHVVMIAMNSLTNYGCLVGNKGPKGMFKPQRMADRCNDRNEVLSLHPYYSMAIIPMTRHKDRNDMGNMETMRMHIRRALISNEVASRRSEMLFALERHDFFDYPLAVQLLQEEAPSGPFTHTQAIYVLWNED
jgi:hypothetical protein